MSVKVKICDVRETSIVETCIKCGVEFIGLHVIYAEDFTQSKKNFLSKVKALVNGRLKLVLVTRETNLDCLLEMCCAIDYDYIQIHFPITFEKLTYLIESLKVRNCSTKVIPVFAGPTFDFEHIKKIASITEYILFDTSYRGGTGMPMSTELYKEISMKAKNLNYFIAGGLTENNVKTVIEQTKPFGVDVQSGVEIKKKKDANLIRRFVNAVSSCAE